jgi:hypothetical protein
MAAEICTKGPSFPTENPANKAKVSPITFAAINLFDSKTGLMTPLSIAFTSGRPPPTIKKLYNINSKYDKLETKFKVQLPA